jgi:hypothetical protein
MKRVGNELKWGRYSSPIHFMHLDARFLRLTKVLPSLTLTMSLVKLFSLIKELSI